MTTSSSHQYLRDVNQSIIYFLNNEIYARSGADSYVTNTLKGFFPGLEINLGYVDDLESLHLPSVTLTPPVVTGGDSEAHGNHVQTESFSYQLFGFMGNQQSHGENLLERDKLAEDIKSLLEDQDYITLRQFDGSNIIDTGGDIEIGDVSFTFLTPDEQPDAAKFRFIVDFDVEYLKKI
jgi:hypothetical protein